MYMFVQYFSFFIGDFFSLLYNFCSYTMLTFLTLNQTKNISALHFIHKLYVFHICHFFLNNLIYPERTKLASCIYICIYYFAVHQMQQCKLQIVANIHTKFNLFEVPVIVFYISSG